MKRFLLIFFLFLTCFSFAQSGSIGSIKSLIANKNFAKANTELNQYRTKAQKLGTKTNYPGKAEVDELQSQINAGLKRQEEQRRLEAAQLANKEKFEGVLNEARDLLSSRDFEAAINKVDEAENTYYSNGQSESLRTSIYQAWSSSFIAEGNRAYNNDDYYEARKQYQYAQDKYYNYEVQERLNSLNSKISSHENYVREAKSAFNNQEYDKAITKLEAASKIIKLGSDGEELKRKCNLFKFQAAGDKALLNRNFEDALNQYDKAYTYASKSDEKSTLDKKKNDAQYEKLSAQALVAFNEKDYRGTIESLYEAQKIRSLESEELTLYNRAALAYDEQTWNQISSSKKTDDFLNYLSIFTNGVHRSDAKLKLAEIYELEGDNHLRNHSYSSALESYRSAEKYTGNTQKINKKINKTYRWRDNLTSDFSLTFGMPLGFNQTSIETEDDYTYIYHIGNNQTVAESGDGIQKLYSYSVITPISISLAKSFTLRIPNVRPMNINLSLSYSANSNSNLNRVKPTNYVVYEDIYEPSSQVIVSTDSLSTYFSNAYKFNQFQLKIGFQPLSFLEVYVPISKQTLFFQNDYSSLDVASDDYEIGGDLAAGLGFKAGYIFSNGIGISGYFENWNKSFNEKSITNQLVDLKKDAGDGLFALKPFSRSVGLIFTVPISSDADIQFSAVNNRIRGNYRGAVSNEALRGFYQNLFTISFKYTL